MAQSFAPWQVGQYAGSPSFNIAQQGGPQPFFRDYYDFRRSAWRAVPEAQYPDGYLGTVHSRRGDRLLDGLKQRQQQRPYSRGVHKGERRDASDYFWTDEFNPESGLMFEAMAVDTPEGWMVPRYVSAGLAYDPMAPDLMPSPVPARAQRGVPTTAASAVPPMDEENVTLARMAPPWGTPSMVVTPYAAGRY